MARALSVSIRTLDRRLAVLRRRYAVATSAQLAAALERTATRDSNLPDGGEGSPSLDAEPA
jgi:hypothetical protein